MPPVLVAGRRARGKNLHTLVALACVHRQVWQGGSRRRPRVRTHSPLSLPTVLVQTLQLSLYRHFTVVQHCSPLLIACSGRQGLLRDQRNVLSVLRLALGLA